MFQELDIKAAYATKQTLKTLLGNPIEKTSGLDKSGIYKTNSNHCDEKYYGQRRRAIRTRNGEILGHIKINRQQIIGRS